MPQQRDLQSLTAVTGPQPRASGLPLCMARSQACPELALALQLETSSLLGAARTSEMPLFGLNGPFIPGFWRTMVSTMRGGSARWVARRLPGGPCSPGRLASASWAQAEESGHCQGTSTCHFAHAIPPAWSVLECHVPSMLVNRGVLTAALFSPSHPTLTHPG